MPESIEVDAYEGKTRLPAMLREVRAGRRFTITQRGEPVAELVPCGTAQRRARPAAVREMQAFMRQSPIAGVDIKALVEEGRDCSSCLIIRWSCAGCWAMGTSAT